MTAIPVWFGPPERLLFGWFHSPAGDRARGGIVICPPLGRDYLRSHYAQRRTAIRLEERGFCCLRFDYDGTGDSVGDSGDPDRVASWLASASEAVGLLRSAGLSWVGMVGMRSGALIASVAAERDGSMDALVLVDPTLSGRGFVSEQRALAAMALGVQVTREDGSIETPGVVYDAQTVNDLKTLRIGKEGQLPAKKVLVMTRKGTSVDSGLRSRLDGDAVEWADATGQENLVDAEAPHQVLPEDDIERIVSWTSTVAPTDTVAVVVPERAGAVQVAPGEADGAAVIERPIALGSLGLFGMVTEVPGRSAGPAMVFLNVATEPHIGPARLWVELARKWAPGGLRSIRVDMSGLGESPSRPGEPEFVIRLPVAFDDVSEIAAAVSPDDPTNVVFVGLCSSAYQALDSALELHPRGVIALNPVLTFQPPEMLDGGPVYPRRRVALPRGNVIQQFSGEGPLSVLRERFPKLAWRVRTLMSFGKRPSTWMKEMTGSGVNLMLICGDREARPIHQGASTRTIDKLTASGMFRFEYIPGLDHGLLVEAHRDLISGIITEHAMGRFALKAGASQPKASEHRASHEAPDSGVESASGVLRIEVDT
ncbi:MAG: alpha/beta fold hydrolase [Acidimicrobiales bacterium]